MTSFFPLWFLHLTQFLFFSWSYLLTAPVQPTLILEWISIMQLSPELISSWVVFTYSCSGNWLGEDFFHLHCSYLLSHIPSNVQDSVPKYVFNLPSPFRLPSCNSRWMSPARTLAVLSSLASLHHSYPSLFSTQQSGWYLLKVKIIILLCAFEYFQDFPLHFEWNLIPVHLDTIFHLFPYSLCLTKPTPSPAQGLCVCYSFS